MWFILIDDEFCQDKTMSIMQFVEDVNDMPVSAEARGLISGRLEVWILYF